ncbi:M1 family aminopeptidase [Wenyingzhuangia sp. chi5]|uniref:M1 family aminopeptidase n=1 Tax=Wenyingzhuangia gilva TaxID=3057677 RepID=A0ABT8VQL4_9FLAO|nr:M1 family aminopeptidase [Wenyingzhuangia sp. chi5]MDO3694264.1 M1 family aminopeptidase [Wenyingzhuangia sp. chi5]
MLKIFFRIIFLFTGFSIYSQNNQITINAQLFAEKNILNITQEIKYFNTSKDTLHEIVLRNWANSYKDSETPLAKRLLEDYKTDFYFSKEEDRGYSQINSIKSKNKNLTYHSPRHQKDLIYINLKNSLLPNSSVTISIKYVIKIPDAKFTGSGKKGMDYYLQDWYISPAPYEDAWVLDSHNNLNYQYNTPTDFNIYFKVPIGFQVHSAFHQEKTIGSDFLNYKLTGKNFVKANISITFLKSYLKINTGKTNIVTDLISEDFDTTVQEEKIQQMMTFLEDHLGQLPHKQILVERETYNQNPIYELKYLPKILHPYQEQFKWEIKFFKTLSSEYVDQMILNNKYKYYCFTEGLEVYLFIQYIEKNYPDSKLMGRLSKIWGLGSMNIAKSKFTDKFSIVHQITARENLDQSLDTPLKELSNYNKKVITPYKAGLSFVFLERYIGKKILQNSIKEYINQNLNKTSDPNDLMDILQKNSQKDLSWFMEEWVNSNKKIDHKINKAIFKKDSVYITLKNRRTIKTPVAIYGLKNNEIKSKTWTDGFTNTKKITIKNDSLDKVILNYENDYPEINNRNNWKNAKPKLFERPLKIKLLKDLNDPNAHQVFLNPEFAYNLYDGVIVGVGIQNKAFIHKNFEYKLKPTYSTASGTLTGGFDFSYTVFPEKTNIFDVSLGMSGSNYHYTKDLNYNVISPYFSIAFKQPNMRAIGTNKITARFLGINKEVEQGVVQTDEDKYQLFKVAYDYRENQLINDYKLNISTEIATKFSKLTTDFRYRHLTNKKRPVEFRFFGGIFLRNASTSDYFSFNQHTANDYLFELPYLGRSETTGFLTQQYVKAGGGFITQNEPGFSNQWLTSINTSIGIVRWVEAFNNISLSKSKTEAAFFDYEGGIRLNFVPDILEFYLPIYNKEGLVTKDGQYFKNIRFTVTLKAQPLIKFFKQQLF